MTDRSKIKPAHLQRDAFVYVRQSTPSQVEHNRESTERQYALANRAVELGWPRQQVTVVDEDLGLSGASADKRSGFARLIAAVAMRVVGIVLGLEVSRLARNNADWYRLLDLCAMTDTLIGDADGLYHPAWFNDRLLLGLKGTMSEAELHIIRARLEGGIRNKAARGELRRGLPTGFIWGEEEGQVLLHPNEAVREAIRCVFARFAELGSARRVWLWLRSEGLSFPSQYNDGTDIRWGDPTYTAIHSILTNPVYAGAYVYGKSRHERVLDDEGKMKRRSRKLPPSQWAVLIHEHHEGYIDRATYDANQTRIGTNVRPRPHQPGGAVREGAALLQGIATCGHCGRKLRTQYPGRNARPGYYCAGKNIVNGRGVFCLNIGGVQIDQAVADALLEALQPAAFEATLEATRQLESNHDTALAQWRLAVERAGYEAQRAERRYRAVDPENRLVARGLEAEWEQRLSELEQARAALHRKSQLHPLTLSSEDYRRIQALGADLKRVWTAPTTTDRDKKELLRTLIEEVIITVVREDFRAHLTLRWRGGMITERDVHLPRLNPARIRTDEDTVELVRRLAVHYADGVIAGILNRQGRKTVRGERFTANQVGSLRRYRHIARFEPPAEAPKGKLVTIAGAADILQVAPSTIHRWLAEGIIPGEQVTPAAPWQIRITDELCARFVEEAPEGYVAMLEATLLLGVSRQTVLQRVKRGELDAVHVVRGRRKGIRIKVVNHQPDLFTHSS
jgi:DNA invertase Pin-like site-specific DNA recombinase